MISLDQLDWLHDLPFPPLEHWDIGGLLELPARHEVHAGTKRPVPMPHSKRFAY